MVCKGICCRYKAKCNFKRFRYNNGQKRCNVCELFIIWDGKYCPCCGMCLRTRPKFSKNKQRCTVQIENN